MKNLLLKNKMETYEELLGKFLKSREIPDNKWGEYIFHGDNVLHFMESDDLDVIKKFIKMGVDVNAKNRFKCTPVMMACSRGHVKNLEYYISIGANLDTPTFIDMLHYRLICGYNHNIIRVLINNGFRINMNAYRNTLHYNEMFNIQNATLRCRSAVVIILTLKKRAKEKFINLDKFVLREIAIALWATRKVEAVWI
jgi:hypothetical protein